MCICTGTPATGISAGRSDDGAGSPPGRIVGLFLLAALAINLASSLVHAGL